MSIVEMLISLAIVALLLTAVAAAFTASSSVIEANDQFFRASQASRVCMNQLLTEIRRTHAVSVAAARLDMITHDGQDRSYVYDSTAHTLKLVTNDNLADPDYTLASNITSLSFTKNTVTDKNGIVHVVRVAVSLKVSVGGNEVQLDGSAAPRREIKYN